MQIFELSSKKLSEGWFSPSQGAQLKQTADKAYKVWTNYVQKVDTATPIRDRQSFRDRTDGKYEKLLTAFVQQNLLKGMQIGTLVNKSEILSLIKQLSVSSIPPASAAATPAAAPATSASWAPSASPARGTAPVPPRSKPRSITTPAPATPANTPGIRKTPRGPGILPEAAQPITIGKETIKPGDPRYAALTKNLPPKLKNQAPGGSSTSPWRSRQSPPPRSGANPGTAQSANTATPATPTQPAAANATPLTKKEEAKLFFDLVNQCTLAMQDVSTSQPQRQQRTRTSPGAVASALSKAVASNPNIKSTGVAEVDKLLTNLGFTVT